MPATGTPFYAFQQSDAAGRVIVLVLFGASILAWAIIVEKAIHLRTARRQIAHALQLFRSTDSARIFLLQLETIHGPLRTIGQTAVTTLARLCRTSESHLIQEMRAEANLQLSAPACERLNRALEGAVDSEVRHLEARLGLLGSIVSASPFLGLLGTVWGVMMAFTGMATAGAADVKAIAPGVSGALLTTVVGLLVAIPALIGFNLLAGAVKELIITMDHFADELLSVIKTEYPPTEALHGTLPRPAIDPDDQHH